MYITTWILTLIAVFTTKNILRISVTCVIYSISSTHSIRAVSIPFFNTLFLLMKRVFFDYVLQKSKDNGIIFIAVLNVFLFFVLIYIGCLEVSVTSHFFLLKKASAYKTETFSLMKSLSHWKGLQYTVPIFHILKAIFYILPMLFFFLYLYHS